MNLQKPLRTWVRHSTPPFNNVKKLPFWPNHDDRDYNLDDDEDDDDTWRHATPSAFVSR